MTEDKRPTHVRAAGLAARGLTVREAAEELGLSRQAVHLHAARHGLEFDTIAKRERRNLQARLKSECSGMTLPDAARKLGVGVGVIRRAEWRLPRRVTVPGNKRLRELSLRIVSEAPGLAAGGLTKVEAAERFGMAVDCFRSKLHQLTARGHLRPLRWRDGRRRRPS